MPAKKELPEWFNVPEVTDWLGKYANVKTNRKNFLNWCEWLDMTPQEQLAKRKADLTSDDMATRRFFEEKIKEYARYLMERKLKAKTQDVYTSSVRAFYSHHYLDLKFRRGELRFRELAEVSAATKPKFVPNNLEVRAMFNTAPHIRDKLLILMLSTSGMSPKDLCDLRIEGFRGIYTSEGKVSEEGAYTVKPRSKTTGEQHILLNREVMFYIAPYLAGRDFPRDGPLLVTRKGSPYTTRAIRERLKQIAIKALGEELGNEFVPKNLRDYFMNAMRLGEIPQDIFDALVGWERQGASSHYPISEEVIRRAHEKMEKELSIDGTHMDSERMARIENQVGKLALGFQAQTEELQNKYDFIERQYFKMVSILEAFTGISPLGEEKSNDEAIEILQKRLTELKTKKKES